MNRRAIFCCVASLPLAMPLTGCTTASIFWRADNDLIGQDSADRLHLAARRTAAYAPDFSDMSYRKSYYEGAAIEQAWFRTVRVAQADGTEWWQSLSCSSHSRLPEGWTCIPQDFRTLMVTVDGLPAPHGVDLGRGVEASAVRGWLPEAFAQVLAPGPMANCESAEPDVRTPADLEEIRGDMVRAHSSLDFIGPEFSIGPVFDFRVAGRHVVRLTADEKAPVVRIRCWYPRDTINKS